MLGVERRGYGGLARRRDAAWAWGSAVDERGRTQHCGVERAFLRLEHHRHGTGVSWWEAKTSSIREAIRQYLADPRYTRSSTAQATA